MISTTLFVFSQDSKLSLASSLGLPNLLMWTLTLSLLLFLGSPSLSVWAHKQKWVWLQIERVGGTDDLWWYVLVYLSLSTLIFTNLYFLALCLKFHIFTTPFFVIIGNLFCLLGLYLYSVGFNFISFIRGCGVACFAVYEYVLDMSNMVSFKLRLSLQTIRLVIIVVTASTLYLFWNEVDSVIMTRVGDLLDSFASLLLVFFGTAGHYVFELGHFFIVFIMQISAFGVMTMWLFQFLYTSYISPRLEA